MNRKWLTFMGMVMIMLLLCACGKKQEDYSVADFEQDMEAMGDALEALGDLDEKIEEAEEWVEDAISEDEKVSGEDAPVEETPVEEAPAEEVPAEEKPAEEVPAEEAPAEEKPVEEIPEEETPAEEAPAEEAPAEETPAQEEGMDPEFKAAMDSYEAFYREYCDVIKRYNANPTDLTILTEYTDLLQKSIDMSANFEAWDESEMNNAELQYYAEVNGRVTQMLLEVGAQ